MPKQDEPPARTATSIEDAVLQHLEPQPPDSAALRFCPDPASEAELWGDIPTRRTQRVGIIVAADETDQAMSRIHMLVRQAELASPPVIVVGEQATPPMVGLSDRVAAGLITPGDALKLAAQRRRG